MSSGNIIFVVAVLFAVTVVSFTISCVAFRASNATLEITNNDLSTQTYENKSGFIVTRDEHGDFSANMIRLDGKTSQPTDVATKSYVDSQSITNNKLATVSSENQSNYIVNRDENGDFATNMIHLDGETKNNNDVATKSYVDFQSKRSVVDEIVPLNSETVLILSSASDRIIIDTSKFSVICSIGNDAVPNGHMLTIQLKYQQGQNATVNFYSGGFFVINASLPSMTFIYSNNCWNVLDLKSFIPKQNNIQQLTVSSPNANLGERCFLSADGLVLAGGANGYDGVFVFVRASVNTNTWTQTAILKGTGNIGFASQNVIGMSVDGETIAIGGFDDKNGFGAAWVFKKISNNWVQQGSKLASTTYANFGENGALSADGNTLCVGGVEDETRVGAVWIYKKNAITNEWILFGNKLIGNGLIGARIYFGSSIAMSADSSILAIGARGYNGFEGCVCIFNKDLNGAYTQSSIIISPEGGEAATVALSANGKTLAIGAVANMNQIGAVWVYTNTNQNQWVLQSGKLVGTGFTNQSRQGSALCLTADGNLLVVGGYGDNQNFGATWLFRRIDGNWSQIGQKILCPDATTNGRQGISVSINSNGSILAIGGSSNDANRGKIWIFQ